MLSVFSWDSQHGLSMILVNVMYLTTIYSLKFESKLDESKNWCSLGTIENADHAPI